MQFFRFFPTVRYPFENRKVRVTDLLTRVTLSDLIDVKQDILYKYTWEEDDTVDSLADIYYDSEEFWWLVLLSAQIHDPWTEIAMNSRLLNKHIAAKWRLEAINNGAEDSEVGILVYTQSTIFEYRDNDGDVIDEATANTLPPEDFEAVTILQKEQEMNDDNRDVNLLTVQISDQVQDQLEDFLEKKETSI